MNEYKRIINILLVIMLMIGSITPLKAFDFATDINFGKFTEGYRSSVTPIKDKDIVWTRDPKILNNARVMVAEVNGSTLSEFRVLAVSADAKIEAFKDSDGTSYFICTGKHDATGHTLLVMMEPKNNLAYVYDTDSYSSEVVNLGAYVQIYNGRTMIPLRKFAEIFGGKVKYYSKGNYDLWWPSNHK